MLLNGHQLYAVIATLFDMWQDIVGKLAIRSHSSFYRAHAHVSLVNFQVLRDGANSWILELVCRLKVYSVEKVCLFILDHISCPCWIPVHLGAIRSSDLNFVLLSRNNHGSSVCLRRHRQRENTELIFNRMILIPVPIIEVAELHIEHTKNA